MTCLSLQLPGVITIVHITQLVSRAGPPASSLRGQKVWPVCQLGGERGEGFHIRLGECFGGGSEEEGADVEDEDNDDKNL